jgi:hypothetical protein
MIMEATSQQERGGAAKTHIELHSFKFGSAGGRTSAGSPHSGETTGVRSADNEPRLVYLFFELVFCPGFSCWFFVVFSCCEMQRRAFVRR